MSVYLKRVLPGSFLFGNDNRCMADDLIADLGGQWGDVNGATNISAENVDHNDPAGMLNYAKNNGYPNIWEQTHQCER